MRDGRSQAGSLSYTYGRDLLLSLNQLTARPSPAVAERVRSLGLWAVCRLRTCGLRQTRYRGRRAGRRRRLLPWLRSAGNGASVIVGAQRPPQHRDVRDVRPPSSLVRIHPDRHMGARLDLTFGVQNVRSVSKNIDVLLEARRDLAIDVLFLTETWHDADSVVLRRLLAEGYQVVDRPRVREQTDSLGTNHGGVAVVAAPGVRLARLDVGVECTSCELLCARITAASSSCIVVIVYRTGPLSSDFFTELSDVLDRTVTYVDPLYVVGDVNIRLDRPDEAASRQLTDTLTSHGLTCRVAGPTHDLGGTIDIVATRDDLPAPHVTITDAGVSDHRLLWWTSSHAKPDPVYTTVTRRQWRQLDSDDFRAALTLSALCRPEDWKDMDVDSLAMLYDKEVTAILDRLIPFRTITCRRRSSDPWFDQECRAAKRQTRKLQRAVHDTDSNDAAAAAAATNAWTVGRRAYRDLLRRKRETFWHDKVESTRSSPRQLWRSIDALMGRGRVPLSDDIDATQFHQHFDQKVETVRAATANAPPPIFSACPVGCSMTDFVHLSVDSVVAAVRALPDKHCASDPIPTSLLKSSADVLAPYFTELFNLSLQSGSVPSVFKAAYVTPLLKKTDMDAADVRSYRPISNLSVLSKLLERLVVRQLTDYLTVTKLLPELQSAYRAFHSTETAVIKVLGDILRALDGGDLAALTLLDLSAAFDSVDHATLLRRLQTSYGIRGTVLNWLASYLSGRTQFVRGRKSTSDPLAVLYGVPQGSVLGPLLFLLYTADLLRLIQRHQLHPHMYADDTQIYGYCSPAATIQLQVQMSVCIDDVAYWMQSNRLQLNTAKTEVLWCASSQRQSQLPQSPLRVGSDKVTPVTSVRDLGIFLDSDASMKTHISRTVSSCFCVLRQLRSIRRSVSSAVLQSLVVSLVLSRLDYGNATLTGVPAYQIARLQSVQNAAARLIYSARKYDPITPLLLDLHWLRVPQRIDYKLGVLVYRCLHGTAPSYLAAELQRVADLESRRRLRSASSPALVIPATRRCTLGDRAFSSAAPRVWNRLPSTVTESPSLAVFKRQLKTHLFTASYFSN